MAQLQVQFTNRQYAYIVLIVGAFSVFIAASLPGDMRFVAVGFSSLMLMLSLAIYKYGHIVIPLFTRLTRIVQLTDTGYEIPPSQDAIIKASGSVYYATMFLQVKIYESASEKTIDENILYNQYFERAISNVHNVAKFCMLIYVKDLRKFRERIESRRAEAQLRLSREREKAEPDILKIDRYEREVVMFDNELARIASGLKPLGAVAYVMTTANGVSKEAALAAAKGQANELRATIANAMNAEVVVLTGEDMMRCFEWEYMLPTSPQELEQQLM